MALKQNWLGGDANCSIEVELTSINPDPPQGGSLLEVFFETKVNGLLTDTGISSVLVIFNTPGGSTISLTATNLGGGSWEVSSSLTGTLAFPGPASVAFTITDDFGQDWLSTIQIPNIV